MKSFRFAIALIACTVLWQGLSFAQETRPEPGTKAKPSGTRLSVLHKLTPTTLPGTARATAGDASRPSRMATAATRNDLVKIPPTIQTARPLQPPSAGPFPLQSLSTIHNRGPARPGIGGTMVVPGVRNTAVLNGTEVKRRP
jgi:hypothetical protein